MIDTLNDLIVRLREMPQNALVKISDGRVPNDLHSWRGDYAQLSIGYSWGESAPKAPTVGWLLLQAESCVGKTFTGYKGGKYVMSGESFIWADNYGEYYGAQIINVVIDPEDGNVVLLVEERMN